MTNIAGKTISECFLFASKVGIEVNAMIDTLVNLFSDALKGDILPCKLAGKTRNHCANDKSGRVTLHEAYSFPLTKKGHRKEKMYIGFQVSMAGENIAFLDNPEPLVYVFCWSDPVDFDYLSISFPASEDDYTEFEVIDDRLIIWGSLDDEWDKREWAYAVKLTALNTPDDLTQYIVKPATTLLSATRSESAIFTEWLDKVIVRLPKKENLLKSM